MVRSMPLAVFLLTRRKRQPGGEVYTALVLVEKDQVVCAPPEIRGSCVSMCGSGWDWWGYGAVFKKIASGQISRGAGFVFRVACRGKGLSDASVNRLAISFPRS